MRFRTALLVVAAVIILLVVLGFLSAKAVLRPPDRLPAVPDKLTTRAEIPGIPNARYWVMSEIGPFVNEVVAARQRERDDLAAHGGGAAEPPTTSLLAVSGGGDNGAFGAGLLCGWTESGKRPEFKAVTGVSTGALIAPFAFAGPEYDHVLRTVYTSLNPEDIAQKRSILAAINNDAMADNRPLWNKIEKFVDDALLAKIAKEYGRGRLLFIGTTNLDARQPVIWNMGAIAASGAPGAKQLFRSILLASAAIPGAFPPTMIPVEVDGKKYEEMHVDGGCSAQVFLYPPRMRAAAAAMGVKLERKVDLYVIRNSGLRPAWAPVVRRTVSIAGPAIASLIHSQGLGDLNRIYLTAQRDGLDFNLAIIDSDFSFPKKVDFEKAFMNALFDYGARQARVGYPWKKIPPMFDDTLAAAEVAVPAAH